MLNMVVYVVKATMMMTAIKAEDENLSLMLQSDCVMLVKGLDRGTPSHPANDIWIRAYLLR